MWITHTLRAIAKLVAKPPRRGPRPAVFARFQPIVEAFEDRMVPSVVAWRTPGGGAWEDPTNWDSGSLPGPADDVRIDNLAAGQIITHRSDATSIHSLNSAVTSAAILEFSGGSLTLGSNSTLNNLLTLNFSGGTIGGSGNLNLNGPFTWTGGTMAGAGTTNVNNGMNISGAGFKSLDTRVLNITGNTATWSGSGDLGAINGAVIDNQANATLIAQTDGDQSLVTGGVTGKFLNEGTFRKQASTGSLFIAIPFSNSNTVSLLTGRIVLSQGGTSPGNFTVAQGATLEFNGGTHRLGGSISGAGTVVFSGGTNEDTGTYNVSGATSKTTISAGVTRFLGMVTSVGNTLEITGGTINLVRNSISVPNATLSGGTLLGVGDVALTNTVSWTGTTLGDTGSTTIGDGTSRATLAIRGSGSKTLDGRVLNLRNNTAATWRDPGSLVLLNGATINNQMGAAFNVQIDDAVVFAGGAVAVFNNAGTFTQDLSTGKATIGSQFNNSGSVVVNTGTLAFNLGGTSNGTFAVAQGATLEFGGGTHRLGGGISGTTDSGTGAVVFSAGTVEVTGTYNLTGTSSSTTISGANASFPGTVTGVGNSLLISAGTADFVSNSISVPNGDWSGGMLLGVGNVTLTNTVSWTGTTLADTGSTTVGDGTSRATLTITGSNSKVLDSRTLTISANSIANWTASTAGIALGNGANLNNAGTFRLQTNQPIANFGATGTITNTGLFYKLNSTGETNIGVLFNNNGQVQIDTGNLVLAAGGVSGGSFTPGPMPDTPVLEFRGGTQRLTASSSINGALPVVFSGGDIEVAGAYSITGTTSVSGNATVNFLNTAAPASSGPFSNAGGTVTLGTGSTLNVSGNYTQTSGTTNLNGATLTAAGANVSILGGTLAATGTITAATFTNGGVLDLGSPFFPGDTPGTLTVNGNYVQTGTGTLDIKIGGPAAGSQFDQLRVNGDATLNGTLTVRLIDGYSPAAPATFQILVCTGMRSGMFSTTNLGGRFVDPPDYNPGDVTLRAI
jgi:hypothetical protein